MKKGDDYYGGFKTVVQKLKSQNEGIISDLAKYKEAIKNKQNSLELGNNIKKNLDSFNGIIEELEKAYKTENLPTNCPQKTADERMQEIKKFRISYEESSKKYIELTNEKLSFKDFITEDYRNKEEYQNKSTEQLQQIQKEKLGEQDEIIDNIIVDTKKGTQLAKNIHHEIGEQNKVIGQIGQDMEMVDSRMNKLTKRFNEYTKKSSTCCLCVFFWCDAIVFGLLVWIYTCVNESGWHC